MCEWVETAGWVTSLGTHAGTGSSNREGLFSVDCDEEKYINCRQSHDKVQRYFVRNMFFNHNKGPLEMCI